MFSSQWSSLLPRWTVGLTRSLLHAPFRNFSLKISHGSRTIIPIHQQRFRMVFNHALQHTSKALVGCFPLGEAKVLTLPAGVQTRSVVKCSKRRGKKKTVKAVAKRFHRTGSGKLKYWPSGAVHNMLSKSRHHRRSLRKPRYANKTQLKTLNKMLAGW